MVLASALAGLAALCCVGLSDVLFIVNCFPLVWAFALLFSLLRRIEPISADTGSVVRTVKL